MVQFDMAEISPVGKVRKKMSDFVFSFFLFFFLFFLFFFFQIFICLTYHA